MKQQLLFGGEEVIDERSLQERIAGLTIFDVAKDILGNRVRPQQHGTKWKGLCPFHQENHASFFLWPDSNVAMCYGCGEHMTSLGLIFAPAWYHRPQDATFTYPKWSPPSFTHDPIEYLTKKVGYRDASERGALIKVIGAEADRRPACYEGKWRLWTYLGVDVNPAEEFPSDQEHFNFSWDF